MLMETLVSAPAFDAAAISETAIAEHTIHKGNRLMVFPPSLPTVGESHTDCGRPRPGRELKQPPCHRPRVKAVVGAVSPSARADIARSAPAGDLVGVDAGAVSGRTGPVRLCEVDREEAESSVVTV